MYIIKSNFSLGCVAGVIVSAQNNVLTAEPLKVRGEAASRMGRRTSFRATTIPPATCTKDNFSQARALAPDSKKPKLKFSLLLLL